MKKIKTKKLLRIVRALKKNATKIKTILDQEIIWCRGKKWSFEFSQFGGKYLSFQGGRTAFYSDF